MSALEDRRLQRLKMTDDHIGRALRDSEASGELQAAPSWGKPLDFGDGYDETPAELRMPLKMLKDAGVVPHEVTLMAEAAALRQELAAATDPAAQQLLRQRLAGIEQSLAFRMERLRATGSL
jgi:Domain of unknown function (DUF1992)